MLCGGFIMNNAVFITYSSTNLVDSADIASF